MLCKIMLYFIIKDTYVAIQEYKSTQEFEKNISNVIKQIISCYTMRDLIVFN